MKLMIPSSVKTGKGKRVKRLLREMPIAVRRLILAFSGQEKKADK